MLFLPYPLKISLSTPKINILEVTYARKWFALFYSKTLKVLDNFAILAQLCGQGQEEDCYKAIYFKFLIISFKS